MQVVGRWVAADRQIDVDASQFLGAPGAALSEVPRVYSLAALEMHAEVK